MKDSEKAKEQLIGELQELRKGELLYRTSFEQSPACMGRAGLDGVLLDVNPVFCSWLGYGRDDLIGKYTHDITHPDDLGITATQLNDSSETSAIKQVLGDHAYQVGISSTKSMTGHIMGATGAIEGVFCILAMRDQILPPTINYKTPDPACDLDYIPNQARDARVRVCLNNAFGFGGHNAVLAFREFES